MNLRPMNDRVVVERIVAEKESPGGILIPERARDNTSQARILAVGPGKRTEDGTRRIPVDLNVGDVVLLAKWAGGQEYGRDIAVIREDDVLAVIEADR